MRWRCLRWIAAGLALGATGCQLFFGSSPAECAADGDCLTGQICERSTCVTGARPPAPIIDQGPVDLAVRVDDGVVDAAVELAVDQGVDAAPDGGAPPFPGGRCFDEVSAVWTSEGGGHVPSGVCTPWAVAWTVGQPGGAALRILRQPGPPAMATVGPVVAPDSPLATDGRFLVFLGPGPDGLPLAQRLDLQHETAVPLSAGGLPCRDVARGEGVSAHVEVGPAETWVVLTFDDDTAVNCRRAGYRQWGVAVGAVQAAWFEAPLSGGGARVVVADVATCTGRTVHPVGGAIAADARLAAAGGGFYWIETPRGAPGRVAGLRPDPRGRLRPVELPAEGGALEVVGGLGPRVAVVTYQVGGFTLDLWDVETRSRRAVAAVSARNPVIAGGWLMWAQAAPFVLWELRYVDLATLR